MSEPLSRSEATREWLEHAAGDLEAAGVLMAGGLWGDVAFYSQQSAEKVAKALLTWHDVPFSKTHLLWKLAALIEPLDPELADVFQRSDWLSHYAWEFRYPGSDEEETEELARSAQTTARRVFDVALARLPPHAHPVRRPEYGSA